MGECGCVYIGIDDSAYCLYENDSHTAELDQECGECDNTIWENEEFELSVMEYEGKLKAYVTCRDCVLVRNQFFCEGWLYGKVWARLRSHVNNLDGKISSDCIVGLTERGREMLLDIIQSRFDFLDAQEGAV